MAVIYGHLVIAVTRALRFSDHVTKRNGGSGDENVLVLTKRHMGSGNEIVFSQAVSSHFRLMAVYLSFLDILQSLILLLYVTVTQQAILSGMMYINIKRSSNSG